MQSLPIKSIQIAPELQARESINQEVVREYADAMRAGDTFPPVKVFFDGASYWLADGYHRWQSYKLAGISDMPADTTQGSLDDAIRYALGANQTHGHRRTNADKRKAVTLWLARWPDNSDRMIAAGVGVSDKTVAAVRGSGAEIRTCQQEYRSNPSVGSAEVSNLDTPCPTLLKRTGADGKQYPAPIITPAPAHIETQESPESEVDFLRDEISALAEENQRLSDRVASQDANESEILIAELRREIDTLTRQSEANLSAANQWQNTAAQMKSQIIYWEKEAKRLGWKAQ